MPDFLPHLGDIFNRALARHPDAQSYLREERGLSPHQILCWKLGYWPRGLDVLDILKMLSNDGMMVPATYEELWRDFGVATGLQGRIIVPLRWPDGVIAAFAGRAFDNPSNVKWLFPPRSKVFDLRSDLFGLHLLQGSVLSMHVWNEQYTPFEQLAKVKVPDRLILVEGLFDTIALHGAGFHVLSTNGTKMTEEQSMLIRATGAKAVYLMPDGDRGGGTLIRTASRWKHHLPHLFQVSVPENMDPDEVLRQFGPEGITELLDSAVAIS